MAKEELLTRPKVPQNCTPALGAEYWRKMCAYLYEDMRPVPLFKQKHVAMLLGVRKTMEKSFGRTLEAVLEGWEGYVDLVTSQKGVQFGRPARPQLEFFVQHSDVASLWANRKDIGPSQHIGGAKTPGAAPGPSAEAPKSAFQIMKEIKAKKAAKHE